MADGYTKPNWLLGMERVADAAVAARKDQSIKADQGKPRLSLVPWRITYAIAAVREYGCRKYGDSESWRKVEASRYRDAWLRHTLAEVANPGSVDEESGLPHLWHAACNNAFLCEMHPKASGGLQERETTEP